LPTGAEDGQTQMNDGRVGTAYIQEFRFNNYCIRLQNLIATKFDQEFKLYLHSKGVNIDSTLFDLKFQTPQNFAAYRQAEVDNARINTFGTMVQQPFVSKRFAMKRFLGLSAEEIAENERLWAEETGNTEPTPNDASGELRSVGLSSATIESELDSEIATEAPPDVAAQAEAGAAAPEAGAETPPPPTPGAA
jgi:hypothetical protein